MIPGINLSDTALVVDDNHLLIALKTTPVYAPGGDALAHAAGRNIDNLAQAVFLNCHTDFTQQAGAVRNILHCFSFAVTKETVEQDKQQNCDDQSTSTRECQREWQQQCSGVMKDISKEAEAKQEENNGCNVDVRKYRLDGGLDIVSRSSDACCVSCALSRTVA